MDYSKYSVLIVDDVPVNLMIVEKMLTNYHFNIIKADNGQKALDIVANSQPDLILLDIMMPGIDGFETLRRLRGNSALPHIPVILMSALNSDADVKKGLSLGANDFLTKPIIKEQLDNCIKNHLTPKTVQGGVDAASSAEQDMNADLHTMLRTYLFCSHRDAVKKALMQVALGVPSAWIDENLFQILQEKNDIVAESKIREWITGKINRCAVKQESVDVCQTVRKVVENMKPVTAERNLSVDVKEGCWQVKTVPDLFECIIQLLIANVGRACSDGRMSIGKDVDGNGTLTIAGDQLTERISEGDFCWSVAKELATKIGIGLTVSSDGSHISCRLAF